MNLEELLGTLESPIVIRPTRRMTQGELESYHDKAADILRGNADHSEFRGQKGNPQNLLCPSDLMRILVPWRAFGDLAAAQRLVPEHEAQLIREVEEQRDARLADIEDAYGPVLEPLARLQTELATLDALDLKQQAVKEAITPEHPYFHPLATLRTEVERIEDCQQRRRSAALFHPGRPRRDCRERVQPEPAALRRYLRAGEGAVTGRGFAKRERRRARCGDRNAIALCKIGNT